MTEAQAHAPRSTRSSNNADTTPAHSMSLSHCPPQAPKNCTMTVKAAPKRRAREEPLRVAAELPESTRKFTIEVSVVGQGVGSRGRGPRDAWREWRSGRMRAGGNWWERSCGRTSAEKPHPPVSTKVKQTTAVTMDTVPTSRSFGIMSHCPSEHPHTSRPWLPQGRLGLNKRTI